VRHVLLATTIAVTGCGSDSGTSFNRLRYSPIGGIPDGVILQPQLVSLPEGASVAARVVAINGSGDTMGCEPTLTADDESIMSIEIADRGSTVFTGISPGSTAILVHCGSEDGSIPGRVTP
jgi:hypothetical protein